MLESFGIRIFGVGRESWHDVPGFASDGALRDDGTGGPVEIVVTAPEIAGTYAFAPADVIPGPVNLVAPRAAQARWAPNSHAPGPFYAHDGQMAPSAVLLENYLIMGVRGLWVRRVDDPVTGIDRQWVLGTAGTAGTLLDDVYQRWNLKITSGMLASGLFLRETVTTVAGARTVDSPQIIAPGS